MERLYSNIIRVEPQFRFNVISGDADDNKFADCAIAANADYIITEDQHFAVLAMSGTVRSPSRRTSSSPDF